MNIKDRGCRLTAAMPAALALIAPTSATAQDGGAMIPLPPTLQAQGGEVLARRRLGGCARLHH